MAIRTCTALEIRRVMGKSCQDSLLPETRLDLCWWQMLEAIYVVENFTMLVTDFHIVKVAIHIRDLNNIGSEK